MDQPGDWNLEGMTSAFCLPQRPLVLMTQFASGATYSPTPSDEADQSSPPPPRHFRPQRGGLPSQLSLHLPTAALGQVPRCLSSIKCGDRLLVVTLLAEADTDGLPGLDVVLGLTRKSQDLS